MNLLLQMLPFYLLGNFHCAGMCGPLVALLNKQRYRHYYFAGRIASFTGAGLLAAALGQAMAMLLHGYNIGAASCLVCGSALIGFSILKWINAPLLPPRLAILMRKNDQKLALLMLQDRAWPSFLFGFFTVLLPCGQTLFVFSACALSTNVAVGALNGFAFGVLTSPALYFAMQTPSWMAGWRNYGEKAFTLLALIAGIFTFCRGLAELEWMPHLSLSNYVVLF